MSCRNCQCKNCKKPKKVKEVSKEEQKEFLNRSATLSYAIGSLWKRIGKDFAKSAELIKK